MSQVPYKYTQYRNNFVGQDRPIYGNEVIPDGGCFPPSKSRQVLSVKQNGSDLGELYYMNSYSGGSMTSVYFNDYVGSYDSSRYREFDKYTRNETLSGYTFTGWQGPTTSGFKMFLFWDDREKGYTLLIKGGVGDDYFNPLYWGATISSSISLFLGAFQADITNDVAYPQTSGKYGLTLNYNPQSCFLPSPTPSTTSNVLPSQTPTPTSTPTPSPSITPTITPTTSISPTPSITPSATQCNCVQYEVNNTSSESQDLISWLDCNQQSQQLLLEPTQITQFCACEGSVQVNNITTTITEQGACGISPSQTPTPTMTPTPSSSGYQYLFQGSNCDDAVDTRIFASNTFVAIGKVIRPQIIDGCYEITGQVFGVPYDDVVSSTYLSCETCPR